MVDISLSSGYLVGMANSEYATVPQTHVTTSTRDRSSYVPTWVSSLGAPVWISSPDGIVSYINERAETLFGRSATDCLGRPCSSILSDTVSSGCPFCGPQSPVFSRLRWHQPIEPVEVQVVTSRGKGRWILLMVIPVDSPEGSGPWLVHCAFSENRANNIGEYLNKVSSRTPHDGAGDPTLQRHALTSRETEILRLLADDESLYSIAERLHISYVTVRNHVQHILTKLGVHSIIEAVAYYLLMRE
ncbi:MAG: PAS domain-containing protein [candidate division Zixibacteria bacterium]|nr:PAS domain-containing protein [candidate division Zixibacteria bacterium]